MEPVKVNEQVVWQDLPDTELVLLHPATGIYYGVNATGARVWRTLATRPLTTGELAADLAATYGLAAADVLADVARLVTELRLADLVTAGPAATTG